MFRSRTAVLLVVGAVAAGTAAVAATAAVRGPAPNLAAIALRPAQIGPGYRVQQRPDGHGVRGIVTLDVCFFPFRSEPMRTDRLQLNYVKRGASMVSNEVVKYRPGGAARALREVSAAVGSCPTSPVDSGVDSIGKITTTITRLSGRGLLPGAIPLVIRIVMEKAKGKAHDQTYVAVYQRRGDLLSAVYGYDGTLTSRTSLALHAAAESAQNLSRR